MVYYRALLCSSPSRVNSAVSSVMTYLCWHDNQRYSVLYRKGLHSLGYVSQKKGDGVRKPKRKKQNVRWAYDRRVWVMSERILILNCKNKVAIWV